MNERPTPMDLERFTELLDAHGAEPARFPETERAAAVELLTHDARARQLHDEASTLARALDALGSPEPSAALRRTVAEIPLRHPRTGATTLPGWFPFHSLSRALVSAALVAMLGVLSGAWTADWDAGTAGAEADDWQDLTVVAFASDLEQELAP